MPDFYKTIKVTQPNLGGPLNESLVGAVQTSNGAPDAGKVVLLNASGQLDSTLGGGSQVSVNGTSIANPTLMACQRLRLVIKTSRGRSVEAVWRRTSCRSTTQRLASSHIY